MVVATAGAQFAATENHLISTPGGWRPAGELVVGDRVMQSVPHYLSDMQWQVLLGGLMGDGALSPTRQWQRCPVPLGAWCEAGRVWRLEGVAVRQHRCLPFDERQGRGLLRLQPLPELAELREAVYVGGKKVLSHDYLKQLTPLSLAVWYMDDGSFSSLEGSPGAHR